MKLLVDMNLSPRWVNLLTSAGIEAAHWSVLGAGNASDPQIMRFAAANGYVVLTHDLDFRFLSEISLSRGLTPLIAL